MASGSTINMARCRGATKETYKTERKMGKEAEMTRDLIPLAFEMANRYVFCKIALFPIGYVCILQYIHAYIFLFNDFYICVHPYYVGSSLVVHIHYKL